MVLTLRFGAVSDIGRNRRKNDDSGYAGPHFLAVADGMGGAPAGDVASSVTIQTLRRLDATPADDMLEALAGALHRANERLTEVIDADAGTEGMGTTVTAALFNGTQIGVAHLGDSRGYLWRDGELLRISRDHTWVQSLVDEGRITAEEAATHSHRNMLLKVLDGRHDNDPDLAVYDVRPGDRIVLCSDGLSGFVPAADIEAALASGSPQAAAAQLTQLALDAGSTDNITVIVGDVAEEADAAGEEPADAEPLLVGAASSQRPSPLAMLRTFTHRDVSQSDEMLLDDPDIDPEELRYAPREPRRFVWLKRGALAAVLILVLCAAGWYGYRWTQQQYYVGAAGENVAIYQGVETSLPGLQMHHVYERQDILLSRLPEFRRGQVIDGLPARDLDDARHIVSELQTLVIVCAQQQRAPSTAPPVTLTPTAPPATQRSPGRSPSGPPGSTTTSPSPRTTTTGKDGTHGSTGPAAAVTTAPERPEPTTAPPGGVAGTGSALPSPTSTPSQVLAANTDCTGTGPSGSTGGTPR